MLAMQFDRSWKARKKVTIITTFRRAGNKKSCYDANHGQSKKTLVILSVTISGFTPDAAGSSR
jgi:hypothetical protein